MAHESLFLIEFAERLGGNKWIIDCVRRAYNDVYSRASPTILQVYTSSLVFCIKKR